MYTKSERNWVLYDVGNSALFMLITAFVPMYFKTLLGAGSSGEELVVYWANAQTVTSLVVAILVPLLGPFADYPGKKIKFFNIFFILGVLGCIVLGFITSVSWFLIVYVLMAIGLNASLVFYDAMLVDVCDEDRMDRVSSSGYAWGYIGSVIPFILSMVVFMKPELIGLSSDLAQRMPFIITGLWWLIFTIPLEVTYEQKHSKQVEEISVKHTMRELGQTIKSICKGEDRRVFYFLLAFFFYIDGIHTVITMSATYGITLNIPDNQMLIAFLWTQFVAFPSALIYGKLANKVGTLRMIRIGVAAYFGGVFFAAFWLKSATGFFALATLIGMFQGGVQGLSRSYFGRIIPKERSNEYFGFYDIFGKAAAVVGTVMVAIITDLTDQPSYGVLSIAILLFIGFLLLIKVQKIDAQTEEA